PAERVPGFLDDGPLEGSLYERLRSRYGIAPLEAHEVYRVALAGEADAALLDVPAGSPAFMIERTSVDARGPFEFTVSMMRGDLYEIRANLRS
ncbi:MAG: UTRA domain-containing protein, partial [Bauldia sp.]|nr:UTRA domain-containing protein [Bauldia sp.]